METIKRLLQFPEGSAFLFGPRGTGKSTVLRQRFPDALFIDLLKPDVLQAYSTHPEKLENVVAGNAGKKTFIIDEIQKEPALLSVVHSLIEKDKSNSFILTGSSARKLKRTAVDLLAGRAIKTTLHPFIAAELGKRFSLESALTIGLIPLVVAAKNPVKSLKTYVSLYIRQEVQSEGLVRNIGNFSRFLEAVSFSHASVINTSNAARECEVERKAVENYITILEDLLVAYRLPVFSKKEQRALVAHPKFYFFDAGVYRTLRPAGPLDRPQEIDGCALEGIVAQHLIAWNEYGGDNNKVYFWRTHYGFEVDFIVYGPSLFLAIEVKNSGKVRSGDMAALKAFRKEYPQCKPILLYRGSERLLIDGILCLPCEEFLRQLHPVKNPHAKF